MLGGCLLVLVAGRVFTTQRKAEPAALPADDVTATALIAQPCKLADGVYLLGDTYLAAVYVVETREGLIMVDSGLEEEHDTVVRGMKALALDPSRLKLILLTHVHGDHSMGAERLRRETGARVCIGREDAEPLRQGGPWEAIFSKFEMPAGVMPHPGTVDIELEDGQVLTLGDTQITAIATPGHTLGSFCFLIEHRGRRLLFSGDTVMSLSDGLGTYSTYLPPKYRSSAGDYLASLKKLRGIPAPDLLLPGHPRSDPIPQDPRLSRDQWHGLLDPGIAELEQLVEHYHRDGTDFLDGTPKQIAEGLYYLGDLGDHAVYAVISGEQLLLFDACGDGIKEFIASAWTALGVFPPDLAAVLLTSCQPQKLAGLANLLEGNCCRIVASPDAHDALRQACPCAIVISPDDLAGLPLADGQGFVIPGNEDAATAYTFLIDVRQVAVTGEVPLEVDETKMPRVFDRLRDRDWDYALYSEFLDKLERFEPGIWLSAKPMFGRNADVYNDLWLRTISLNRLLLRRAIAPQSPF